MKILINREYIWRWTCPECQTEMTSTSNMEADTRIVCDICEFKTKDFDIVKLSSLEDNFITQNKKEYIAWNETQTTELGRSLSYTDAVNMVMVYAAGLGKKIGV